MSTFSGLTEDQKRQLANQIADTLNRRSQTRRPEFQSEVGANLAEQYGEVLEIQEEEFAGFLPYTGDEVLDWVRGQLKMFEQGGLVSSGVQRRAAETYILTNLVGQRNVQGAVYQGYAQTLQDLAQAGVLVQLDGWLARQEVLATQFRNAVTPQRQYKNIIQTLVASGQVPQEMASALAAGRGLKDIKTRFGTITVEEQSKYIATVLSQQNLDAVVNSALSQATGNFQNALDSIIETPDQTVLPSLVEFVPATRLAQREAQRASLNAERAADPSKRGSLIDEELTRLGITPDQLATPEEKKALARFKADVETALARMETGLVGSGNTSQQVGQAIMSAIQRLVTAQAVNAALVPVRQQLAAQQQQELSEEAIKEFKGVTADTIKKAAVGTSLYNLLQQGNAAKQIADLISQNAGTFAAGGRSLQEVIQQQLQANATDILAESLRQQRTQTDGTGGATKRTTEAGSPADVVQRLQETAGQQAVREQRIRQAQADALSDFGIRQLLTRYGLLSANLPAEVDQAIVQDAQERLAKYFIANPKATVEQAMAKAFTDTSAAQLEAQFGLQPPTFAGLPPFRLDETGRGPHYLELTEEDILRAFRQAAGSDQELFASLLQQAPELMEEYQKFREQAFEDAFRSVIPQQQQNPADISEPAQGQFYQGATGELFTASKADEELLTAAGAKAVGVPTSLNIELSQAFAKQAYGAGPSLFDFLKTKLPQQRERVQLLAGPEEEPRKRTALNIFTGAFS